MMVSYQKLSQRPGSFKSLTGLTVAEFDALYAQFALAWAVAEEQRLHRRSRQRAIGGGRRYRLSTPTQLLMVLMWLRLYLGTEALGVLFDIDKATVSRNNRRTLAVLRVVTAEDFGWPDPPARGEGKTLGEALQSYPDLAAVLDTTEQPVQRPQDKAREKRYFSGKSHRHTCKNAIVVNEHGLIRTVTPTTPGAMHELTHVRQAGVLAQIPRQVAVVADAGFDGLYKDLPDHSVATAHKAQRNHPLTPDQRAINRELSALRVIVENVFAHLKHFHILADRFRHQVERCHSEVFWVVAALVNRRTRTRLLRAT
jgi:transposase